MKKTAISFMLVLAMVLAMVLVPAPAAEAAGAKHDHTAATNHCVCGATSTDGTNWTGGAKDVGGHSCEAESGWIELTNANLSTYSSGSNGNGLLMNAGNYYLGETLNLTSSLQLGSNKKITICLNGFDINATGKRALYFGGGNITVNLCDCQGGGEIRSNTTDMGASVRVNHDTAKVYLYSVTLVGSPNTTGAGGTLRVEKGTCSIYNTVIKNGKNVSTTNSWGGNVALINSTAKLFMYGGRIENGTADVGGNIYLQNSSTFTMEGGAIIGGSIERGTDAETGEEYPATVTIKGGFVELDKDLTLNEKVTINATNDLVVDLNGHKLAGTASINAGDKKLSIVDTTAAKGEAGTGLVADTVEIEGTLAQGKPLPAAAGNKAGQRYVTIDGVAHRIYIGIENIQLSMNEDKDIGMSYTTNFQADAAVLEKLANTNANSEFEGYAFGYRFGQEELVKAYGFGKDGFKAKVTANIGNVLDSAKQWDANSDSYFTKIWAQTFICLDLGGAEPVVIESNTYKISLKDVVYSMMEIDNNTEDGKELSAAAKEILTCIVEDYDYLFAC